MPATAGRNLDGRGTAKRDRGRPVPREVAPPASSGSCRPSPTVIQEGVRHRRVVAQDRATRPRSTPRCFSSLHDLVGDLGVRPGRRSLHVEDPDEDALISVAAELVEGLTAVVSTVASAMTSKPRDAPRRRSDGPHRAGWPRRSGGRQSQPQCRAAAVGGAILFAFLTLWSYGRESAYRTLRGLPASPMSRGVIVVGKAIVVGGWEPLITAWIDALGFAVGLLVGLPEVSAALGKSVRDIAGRFALDRTPARGRSRGERRALSRGWYGGPDDRHRSGTRGARPGCGVRVGGPRAQSGRHRIRCRGPAREYRSLVALVGWGRLWGRRRVVAARGPTGWRSDGRAAPRIETPDGAPRLPSGEGETGVGLELLAVEHHLRPDDQHDHRDRPADRREDRRRLALGDLQGPGSDRRR